MLYESIVIKVDVISTLTVASRMNIPVTYR